MRDLDLLVPSALVDPGISSELLRDQAMPNLARVLAFGTRAQDLEVARHASLTPWQAWVFRAPDGSASERVNLGELWAMACGIAPAGAGRYVVEPAHFTLGNDHLRLDDPARLGITLVEARALVAVCQPVLREAGWRLDPVEPATLTHWLATRSDDGALSGAAIERAIGDNVAAWQPRVAEPAASAASVDAALAWRRCVNEIQMLWFGHPVNEAREARGQPAINTLWLSGNGVPVAEQPPLPRYAAIDSGLPLLAALAIDPDAPRMLESFDSFIEPVRREDWSTWRSELARFDARLGVVLRGQAEGSIGALTLVLCGRDRAKVTTVASRDLRRVWRGWFGKPVALADVFADGVAADAAEALP